MYFLVGLVLCHLLAYVHLDSFHKIESILDLLHQRIQDDQCSVVVLLLQPYQAIIHEERGHAINVSAEVVDQLNSLNTKGELGLFAVHHLLVVPGDHTPVNQVHHRIEELLWLR